MALGSLNKTTLRA